MRSLVASTRHPSIIIPGGRDHRSTGARIRGPCAGVSLWSRCCVPFISARHPRGGDDLTRSRPHDRAGEPARRPWPAHRRRRASCAGPCSTAARCRWSARRRHRRAVWPPATVIDLRSPAEFLGPHPLAEVAAVHQVPLGASLAPALAAAQTDDPDLTFAYRHLARDAAAEIAGIIGLVATAPGPILVHCTAGKDRTGIVVAALLRAIGVRRDRHPRRLPAHRAEPAAAVGRAAGGRRARAAQPGPAGRAARPPWRPCSTRSSPPRAARPAG